MKGAAAFCPAHITGFFSIRDQNEDILKNGSRGAGLNIVHGARAVVKRSGEGGRISITINSSAATAPITTHALRILMEQLDSMYDVSKPYDSGGDAPGISVSVSGDLPGGQGFGMSAAGSFAAALALCGVFHVDGKKALELSARAAHTAEIIHGGGLGDVAGQIAGGMEIRLREGIPPFGKVMRLPAGKSKKVLLLWSKDGLSTARVLRDPVLRRKITAAGRECLAELEREPSLENLMELSHRFSIETGLMPDALGRICDVVRREGGMASMCMLGNSIFAIDPDEGSAAERVLEEARRSEWFGGSCRTEISERGACMLDDEQL